QDENLRGFVNLLAAGENALVRLDLPAGENLKVEPIGARLSALADADTPVEAKFFDAAPSVDAQTQGQGFLFLVWGKANQSRFKPGAAVTGFIKMSGDSQPGVLVPRNAVVRFNGTTWIYLQTGEDNFARAEVALGSPLTDGWFVREGLKAQDKVVTVGAQQLLSEELKGQIGGD